MKRSSIINMLPSVMALVVLGILSPKTLPGEATANTSVTQVPILVAVSVPCAGEIAVLSGDLQIMLHTTIDERGGTHVEAVFNPQGISGVGLTTGDKYQGTGVTRSHANTSGPPPFEYISVNNFNIIGQGPDNNVLVHFNTHILVSPDGTTVARVDNFRLECK